MKLAKWNWKKLLRDWKTRILCVAFFIFFASFSMLFRQQNLPLPLDEMRSRYEVNQQLFNIIPESEFEGELGAEVYDLLTRQQRLYGMQRYILSEQEGNTVGNLERVVANYVENGLEIADIQLKLWELTEFNSHQMISTTLPEIEEVEKEKAFLTYLKDHDLDIEWNPFSASHILQEELEMLSGIVLFVFVALLGADRFTLDQTKNWSVTQGIPVPWKKQWRQRASHLWILMWGVVLSGMAVSYISSLLRETPGSLEYPVSLFTGEGSTNIALWQYGLLLIVFSMLLSVVLILLSTGSSWMIRNVYLTIVIVLGVYYLPYIWSIIPPYSSFQPSLYIHIPEVLKGIPAEVYSMNGLNIWKLPVMLLALWGVVELIFSRIFHLIPTQTIGLKRRETA